MVQVEFLKFQNQVNKRRGVNQNSNFPCNKGKLEFFGKCLLKLSVCKQRRSHVLFFWCCWKESDLLDDKQNSLTTQLRHWPS